MLCSKCKHKHYDYCEDCMECDLFADEFPEEYERKDECGCIFNERTIVSRIKAKEEEYHQFVKEMYQRSANTIIVKEESEGKE